MTKIPVTSGAGFLGSHVGGRCLEHGFEVVMLNDLSTRRVSRPNPTPRFYQMDRRNPEICQVFEKERVV